jgi:hypothetical protein
MSENKSLIQFKPLNYSNVDITVLDTLGEQDPVTTKFWVTYFNDEDEIEYQDSFVPQLAVTSNSGTHIKASFDLSSSSVNSGGRYLINYTNAPLEGLLDTDVESYMQAITANGGSIDPNQILAINKFVVRAKKAGYWEHLIEVSPLAGVNLAAAQVKLKSDNNISNLLNFDNLTNVNYNAVSGIAKSFNLNYHPLEDGRIIRGLSVFVERGSRYVFGSGLFLDPVISLLVDEPMYVQWHIGHENQLQTPLFMYGRSNWDYINNPYTPFYHGVKQQDAKNTIYVNGDAKVTSTVYDPLNTNRTQYPLALNLLEGKVFMYCIDDGGFTDTQIVQFNEHMHLLMYDLVRLEKPPVINTTTTVNLSQVVTITN